MKYRYSLLMVLAMLLCADLFAQKDFEYPEDSVTAESRKAFDKTFKQGRILFNTVCGSCHNFKEKNKEIVPDFSMPQLMDYEMRRAYPNHMDRLDDKHVTDDEMNKIILFLRFKKKSGREFPVRAVGVVDEILRAVRQCTRWIVSTGYPISPWIA